MPIYTYSFLGLVQQLTNLTAAPSRLIKDDLFLKSASLVLFPNLTFSNFLTLQSVYLKLLIFLPANLIPACASSSPAFHMMYCAYKLNKQGDNIQPWCIPFPIWNQYVVPRPVLTLASWPADRFLRRKVRCKHPLPTTQEKTLHTDITRWSILKSDWLHSLKPKMEKLYMVSKNKTGSWLWLRPWIPYCQNQT